MISAGWAGNNLLVSNKQDGKSVQRGQISLSVLQHNLWLSQNKLGPCVRWERPHLRLPLPGWVPDVPRLWNGHGKRGLWTGSVILEQWHVFIVPSRPFKECEPHCVVFRMLFPALSEGCAQPVFLQLKGYIEFLKFPETVLHLLSAFFLKSKIARNKITSGYSINRNWWLRFNMNSYILNFFFYVHTLSDTKCDCRKVLVKMVVSCSIAVTSNRALHCEVVLVL